jgi:hypothetical protein
LQLAKAPPDVAEMLTGVPGVRSVTPLGAASYEVVCDGAGDPRPDLPAMAVHRGWGLLEMRSAAMSLEEVFPAYHRRGRFGR